MCERRPSSSYFGLCAYVGTIQASLDGEYGYVSGNFSMLTLTLNIGLVSDKNKSLIICIVSDHPESKY